MGKVLNQTPSGTQAATLPGPATAPGLDPGESYCSPEEERLLNKTMMLVEHSLNDPKKLRMIEAWLVRAHDLGMVIGTIAVTMLMSIYDGAKHSGHPLPPEVFLSQGGAVFQTIDRLLMLSEHFGLHPDPDDVREKAIGVVMDTLNKHYSNLASPGSSSQKFQAGLGIQPNLPPGHPQMMAANPLSHGIQQGLQQQGLMGAQP